MSSLRNLSQPEYRTVHEKNVAVPMRDGTILRANVTRPDADGRFPVLVERTPYNKEAGSENAVGAPEYFARRGYAVVIQDVRGRFASDGDFYPFRDDGAGRLRDGYDTIEWAARQPWSDHWLKGRDTGVLDGPPVRLFVMGRNEWRDEADWPLPDTRYTHYYFHTGPSGSIRSLNDGALSPEPPAGGEHPDSFIYDPAQPVPSRGGNTLSIPNGVYDQREVEALSLTYTSAPLTEELEVTGPVTAVLYGLSSAPDTDWVVRLTDVHPDGYARLLCDGILRARYRDSFQFPRLLEPGKLERYEIDLWATSNVFLPGHRLRVSVTSSCFPRFDRNLNTGGPIHQEAAGQVAINTVFHDALRPSHIVLPVIRR